MPTASSIPNHRLYTGIGSRRTPSQVLKRISCLAHDLQKRGWRLRSGGAQGADRAFEEGAGGDCDVFRPHGDLDDAKALFEAEVRPLAGCGSIYAMKPFVASLLARNMYQILGRDLQTPSKFVVCWTPTLDYASFEAGGTRYALLLAQSRGIRIFNLKDTLAVPCFPP